MATKAGKRAPTRAASGGTGRDGAFDFALKAELNESMVMPGSDHIYRVIEIVGTSETNIEDAIKGAIARAHKTLRNLRWFEVVRTSGHIDVGNVTQFQVTLKVGFTMEQPR